MKTKEEIAIERYPFPKWENLEDIYDDQDKCQFQQDAFIAGIEYSDQETTKLREAFEDLLEDHIVACLDSGGSRDKMQEYWHKQAGI